MWSSCCFFRFDSATCCRFRASSYIRLVGAFPALLLRPFCALPFDGVVAFGESAALDLPLGGVVAFGASAALALRFADFETAFFPFAFVVFSALFVASSSRRFASSALFFFRSSSRSF